MLAGHAYALGASLVTLNPSDFELIQHMVPIIVPERTS
jgi:predicted nucleic acid-binding protein